MLGRSLGNGTGYVTDGWPAGRKGSLITIFCALANNCFVGGTVDQLKLEEPEDREVSNLD